MTFWEIFHLVVQTAFPASVVLLAYVVYRNALITGDHARRIGKLEGRLNQDEAERKLNRSCGHVEAPARYSFTEGALVCVRCGARLDGKPTAEER